MDDLHHFYGLISYGYGCLVSWMSFVSFIGFCCFSSILSMYPGLLSVFYLPTTLLIVTSSNS